MEEDRTEGLPADRTGPTERKMGDDRRCQVCGTKLSLYNAGPNCWQHTIGWPWRGPSAKPRF